MHESPIAQLESALWPEGSSRDAWMLVDCARNPRIFGLMLECFYSDHACLFAGPFPPEIEVVAPYLVQLTYGSERTRKFLRHAQGNSWGVFLHCSEGQRSLRRHLRTLLRVRGPNGDPLFFRYYDPRVLRVYLPTCTPAELKAVFGPIDRFLIESESPGSYLHYMQDSIPTDFAASALP